MIVLAKFIRNDNPRSRNLLITKTLGKFGVPDRDALVAMRERPQHDEWWRCDVVRETGAGTNRGLFVLRPLTRIALVERDGQRTHDLTYLYPAGFSTQQVHNTILIHPNHRGPNWILSNEMRRQLLASSRNINAVLVVMDNKKDWPRETVRRSVPILDGDQGGTPSTQGE